MAKTRFWVCDRCAFVNTPHSNRQTDEAQKTCEQCGAPQASGHDLAPAEAVSMKRGS